MFVVLPWLTVCAQDVWNIQCMLEDKCVHKVTVIIRSFNEKDTSLVMCVCSLLWCGTTV